MVKGAERRDARITVRIPSSLLEAIEREAEEQRRSVADVVMLILSDALTKRRKGK